MTNPDFRAAVQQRNAEITRDASAHVRSLSGVALLTLEQIMRDPDQPAAARVSAAKEVLDRAGITGVTRIELTNGDPLERLQALVAKVTARPERPDRPDDVGEA